MKVICEHAAQCEEEGLGLECWHTVAHSPIDFKGVGPVAECDCLTEMKCTATGKQCRCVPVVCQHG
jgi:hypothetical protein